MWLSDLSEEDEEHERVDKFIKDLHVLDTIAPAGDKPITIIMNHSGGEIYAGMAIYDAIKQAKNHVTILVRGMACSMGAIILQAADHRVVAKHSVVMIHHGQSGYEGHKKEVTAWHTFDKAYCAKLDDILYEKIREKKKRFKREQLDKMQDFDSIYTAEKAVAWGLADEVEDEP